MPFGKGQIGKVQENEKMRKHKIGKKFVEGITVVLGIILIIALSHINIILLSQRNQVFDEGGLNWEIFDEENDDVGDIPADPSDLWEINLQIDEQFEQEEMVAEIFQTTQATSSNEDTTIHLQKSHDTDIQEHRKIRSGKFNSWFEGNRTDRLYENADKDGPILDFAIIGFPKCGTTTMEANLGNIAPMPIADVCTPVHQTVYYSYINWPKEFGEGKKIRGTKCPAFIQDTWLLEWSKHLPKTKLILGIRHPILWFQSFWNMQKKNSLLQFAQNDPYRITKPCDIHNGRGCHNDCPRNQLFCVQRGAFHVSMARLGKTNLTTEERMLLSAKTYPLRAGANLENHDIKNPVFLYEINELNEEYIWDALTEYLDLPEVLSHDKYVSSHGKSNRIEDTDFCNEKFDEFRAVMMLESYDLSTWLQHYFIPLGEDDTKEDVIIPKPERLRELVEEYKYDPCERLIRLGNGTFVLGDNITSSRI